MKKNRALSLLLITVIILTTCLTFFVGANADSANLLEVYNCNPRFTYGISPWGTLLGSISQSNKDSADGDGYCALLTNRTQEYSNAHLTGDKMLQIFSQQGSGTYYYSFYVKCVNKNDSCMLSPTFELYYQGAQDTAKTGKWLTDPSRKGFAVTGTKWTKIEIEFDLDITFNKKPLVEAKIYSIQRDFENNAIDLMFDNFTLIKKSNNTATPSNSFSNVTPNERTGIGAIYYNMWFQTLNNWWQYDNKYALSNDRNSVQEARSLSPKAYHERMPFFAKLNKSVTNSKYIKGDLSAGVVEFPDFSETIWRQEMEYAIEAGIDFMAYLWTQKGRKYNASAYQHHINTKGLNGRMQMCAILQTIDQDIDSMAKAMCEPYWYCVDNMPVVYIFGGTSAATDELIAKIRRTLAQAQYAKFGKVGEPAYIIVMGVNSYSEAVNNASRGIDATSWYAFSGSSYSRTTKTAGGATVRQATYSNLASNAMSTMKSVSKVATNGYMAVSPLISLGYDLSPRIDNPVSWMSGGNTITARPTAQEITKTVTDVLNWNRQNRDTFKCNTVIFYAWNEFTEGGWICPTAQVDANGNIIKNADGTTKVNRTHLDAVKAAIKAYRQANNEAFNVTVDVSGKPQVTPTPTINPDYTQDDDQTFVTATPTALPDNNDGTEQNATPEPTPTTKPNIIDNIIDGLFGKDDKNDNTDNTDKNDNKDIDNEEQSQNRNKLVFLLPIGIVVIIAAAAVIVVIFLKKKKNAQQTEKAEE